MAGAGSAGEPHGRRRRGESVGRTARARDHAPGGAGSTERANGTDRAGDPKRAGGPTGPAGRADSGTPSGPGGGERAGGTRQAVVAYFRANPQVFVLLVICLVLGLGTFVAVLIALATAGTVQTTGEPSGAVQGLQTLASVARPLVG